jgi:hypothetical protein
VGCGAKAAKQFAIDGTIGATLAVGRFFLAAEARAASAQAIRWAKLAGGNSGAAAGLTTKSGKVFLGYSKKSGGPQGALHPTIQAMFQRAGGNPCKGRVCAELDVLSRALWAGESLNGAQLSVRTLGRNGKYPLSPGTSIPPCSSCSSILRQLGVTSVD